MRAAALRTGSLRRRTILAVLALLALVLIVLAVAVDLALGARLRGQVEDRLRDRAAAAASLVGTVDDAELAERLSAQGLAVRIDSADGGSVVAGPSPDQLRQGPPGEPGAGGPGAGGPPEPLESASTSTDVTVTASAITGDEQLVTLTSTLSDGSTVTLTASTAGIDETLVQVRWVFALASLVVLALAAGAVVVIVGATLRPLDRVSEVARSIAAGDRDHRMRPTRRDTEIGRVAASLDDMLDDVVGAETAARSAEARLRAFLADAAHELRTPVAGMRAAAETLVHADLDGADREALAARVVQEASRASRLVDDLLTMARVDQGLELRPRPVDLRELLARETERMLAVHPGLHLELRRPERPAVVLADADRIAQVVSNLVDNAARATGHTGQVTIALDTAGAVATIAVTDDGSGVPDDERERIFERLVRLDPARSARTGAGLGLPIARGIARAHGGDVVCEPHGGGARFVLTLPIASPGASATTREGARANLAG